MSKKEKVKKEKDSESSIQLVKSAAAVLCTAALCVSAVTTAGKLGEAKIKEAELTPVYGVSASAGNSAGTQSGAAQDSSSDIGTDTPADAGSTDTADEGTTEAAQSDSGSNASTPAAGKSETAKSGVPSTNAEIIEYCNKALNDAKQAKVGYTKTFVRKGGDNLPSIVSSIIAQNKVTTAQKGSDAIVDDFPAGGFAWSSKLRESDVSKVEFKQNGQYYEITLRLPDEKNPGKGETSKYGRAMTVITEADAKDMLSAVKSAELSYHDGYVYAKIDSKTGKLVKAEFSATADLAGNLALIGDLKAENIVSTETFTDIKW